MSPHVYFLKIIRRESREQMEIIRLEAVKKVYQTGDIACEALRGVSLEIEMGSIVSIVGRSGSGKSTLMHVSAGLDSVTEGRVFIDGEDISRYSEKALCNHRNKKTGFIFQSFFLEPAYSVFDNISMPLVIAGMSPKLRRNRVAEVSEAVGIAHKLSVPSGRLSGGEKQRVAIARAIVHQPPIVFADEPCGNLDSENSGMVMDLLEQLHRMGTTVVLVTHNAEDAKRANRMIKLRDGRVESDEVC